MTNQRMKCWAQYLSTAYWPANLSIKTKAESAFYLTSCERAAKFSTNRETDSHDGFYK